MVDRVASFGPRTLDELAGLLKTRRVEVAQAIEALHHETVDALTHRDLSDLFDDDLGIGGDADTVIALEERAEQRLLEIDEALVRVADGTYGYCVDCHARILLERLRTLPATLRCSACSLLYSREA